MREFLSCLKVRLRKLLRQIMEEIILVVQWSTLWCVLQNLFLKLRTVKAFKH